MLEPNFSFRNQYNFTFCNESIKLWYSQTCVQPPPCGPKKVAVVNKWSLLSWGPLCYKKFKLRPVISGHWRQVVVSSVWLYLYFLFYLEHKQLTLFNSCKNAQKKFNFLKHFLSQKNRFTFFFPTLLTTSFS